MLEDELKKFRVFNKLGHQPIFSTLIMGKSGIGKTELARILHRNLSPTEPFIKINFGNYSDQNALNSLIGSPRGYAGSNKGELTDKLLKSRSNVILIDEFEKSHQSVQNFFCNY
ncbi:MAG: AAA family ATPase [Blautia sp.]|nr:AAA family ATPase [Blautia sp.]